MHITVKRKGKDAHVFTSILTVPVILEEELALKLRCVCVSVSTHNTVASVNQECIRLNGSTGGLKHKLDFKWSIVWWVWFDVGVNQQQWRQSPVTLVYAESFPTVNIVAIRQHKLQGLHRVGFWWRECLTSQPTQVWNKLWQSGTVRQVYSALDCDWLLLFISLTFEFRWAFFTNSPSTAAIMTEGAGSKLKENWSVQHFSVERCEVTILLYWCVFYFRTGKQMSSTSKHFAFALNLTTENKLVQHDVIEKKKENVYWML